MKDITIQQIMELSKIPPDEIVDVEVNREKK